MRFKIQLITFPFLIFLFGFILINHALAANFTLSGSIKDNSGTAIVGASISVNDATSDSTITNSSGNYSLSIPQGTYNVQVNSPAGSNFSPAVALSQNISSDTVLNFVLVPAGTVTLSGYLYDSLKNSVPGQNIQLKAADGTTVTSVTDSGGHYNLQVSPAAYTLIISGTNNPLSLNVPQNYNLTINSYQLTQSNVVNFIIPAKKVSLHTQDTVGIPIGNVQMGISIPNGNITNLSIGSGITANIAGANYGGFGKPGPLTDSSGNATVWLLPNDNQSNYTITAIPPNGSNFKTTTTLNVVITTDTSETIIMVQPVTLSGHLYDSLGNIVTGQNIQLKAADGTMVTSTTDASGNYFLQASPANYQLIISGNNNPLSLNIPQSYTLTVNSFSLLQNKTVDFTIPAKRVSLLVKNASNNPMSNIQITANIPNGNITNISVGNGITADIAGANYGGFGKPGPLTDSTGSATIWLLPNDASSGYTLTAIPPMGSTFQNTILSNVVITSDTSKTITMIQPVTLVGHIYDQLGNFVPGQKVQLGASDGTIFTSTTDNSGSYSIQVTAATYTLTISGTNNSLSFNVPQNYNLTVNSYQLTQSNVVNFIIPARKVSVHIQDNLGNSVSNVQLGVSIQNGNITNLPIGGGVTANIAGANYGGFGNPGPATDSSGNVTLWLLPNDTSSAYTLTAIPPSGSIYSQFVINNLVVTSNQSVLISLQYNHATPVTTINLSTLNSGGTYTDPTTVTLSAVAASGYTVTNTYYKVDGDTQQTYAAPFTISGSGSHTIAYWSVDNKGVPETPNTKTFSVDDPPKINSVPGATINEGSTYTATGSFTDPDSTSWTGTVDYGDGSGVQTLTLNPDKTFTLSHQYLDNKPNNAPYTVTVTITDNQGAGSTVTTSVVVNNVPPTVSPIAVLTNPVALANSASVDSVSFTDPGVLDTHTAVWNWGDGTTSEGTVIETNGSGYVSATDHVYATTGLYTITLTVTDTDGASGNSSSQYVAVYQPTNQAHFMGNGYFMTPTGSYMQNPSYSGKASLHMNVKYANGGTVTGNAELILDKQNFSFKASSFKYLVISENKAYLVGTGTVNNQTGYTFLASGIGGQQSTNGSIRFQIKDTSGNVVFDTQPGAAGAADPTTAITGQVVVHN